MTPLTKHVVTRWYRAPEIILFQPYSYEVDIWALGCVLCEMLNMMKDQSSEYTVETLFPGESCFPLSPGPDDPDILNDNLDEFSFSQVTGKKFKIAGVEKLVEIEQLDTVLYIIGTPKEDELGWLN